jgi:hypothetical protein
LANPPVSGEGFLLKCLDDGKRRSCWSKGRSSQEVQRLVAEFESSGLGQNEFCRKEGLALGTLQRQLKKRHLDKCETPHGGGLVRVELAPRNPELKSPERSALEAVLSKGRKIAVWPDFDSGTLERLFGALWKRCAYDKIAAPRTVVFFPFSCERPLKTTWAPS